MAILLLSFIGGVLTVAAPCVLPLLPVIIGRNIDISDQARHRFTRPLTIAISLAVSVIVFTLILKASTSLLGIPQSVWQWISGIIIILLGTTYLIPQLWETVAAKLSLQQRSGQLLTSAHNRPGFGGDIITGAALGPIFNSCSPTYAFIIAIVIPSSIATGLYALTAYALGMSLTLMLIGILGNTIIKKLGWLKHPTTHKIIGLLFILVGLGIMFGLDKALQTAILDAGWYSPIENLEQSFRP